MGIFAGGGWAGRLIESERGGSQDANYFCRFCKVYKVMSKEML